MTTQAKNKEEKICNHKLKCIHCEKEFVPLRPTKKYCSDSCRLQNFYERKYSSVTMIINLPKAEKKGTLRKFFSLIW